MKRIVLILAIAMALSSVAPIVVNAPADACPRHNPRC